MYKINTDFRKWQFNRKQIEQRFLARVEPQSEFID